MASLLPPSLRDTAAPMLPLSVCEFPVVARAPPLTCAFHSTALTSSTLPYSNFGLPCAAAARATSTTTSAARAPRTHPFIDIWGRTLHLVPLRPPRPERVEKRRGEQRVREQVADVP